MTTFSHSKPKMHWDKLRRLTLTREINKDMLNKLLKTNGKEMIENSTTTHAKVNVQSVIPQKRLTCNSGRLGAVMSGTKFIKERVGESKFNMVKTYTPIEQKPSSAVTPRRNIHESAAPSPRRIGSCRSTTRDTSSAPQGEKNKQEEKNLQNSKRNMNSRWSMVHPRRVIDANLKSKAAKKTLNELRAENMVYCPIDPPMGNRPSSRCSDISASSMRYEYCPTDLPKRSHRPSSAVRLSSARKNLKSAPPCVKRRKSDSETWIDLKERFNIHTEDIAPLNLEHLNPFKIIHILFRIWQPQLCKSYRPPAVIEHDTSDKASVTSSKTPKSPVICNTVDFLKKSIPIIKTTEPPPEPFPILKTSEPISILKNTETPPTIKSTDPVSILKTVEP